MTTSQRHCDVCKTDFSNTLSPTIEVGFTIEHCPSCNMGFTNPALGFEKIKEWYPPQYYGKENIRFNPLFEYLVRWFRKRRAKVLRRRVPAGQVLDVGCGRGFILHYLKKMGYGVQGVELIDAAAWHAREILKVPVEVGDFLKASIADHHYEAVVFWHTLEHFSNPEEILSHAYKKLKTGGLLTIAVPNYGSWQAKFFGRFWFHLDIPRHYCHFTVPYLKKVLQKNNFRIVQLDHFSFEQNPYGLLQSIYNALGFRWNLLYSLLKDRSARTDTAKKYPFQTTFIVLSLPVFLPLTLVFTLLETALRSGGTIEVYAVKER